MGGLPESSWWIAGKANAEHQCTAECQNEVGRALRAQGKGRKAERKPRKRGR